MTDTAIANCIREATTSTGTGPVVLIGAVSGYLPFSAIAPGGSVQVKYRIEYGSGASAGVEVGIGLYDDTTRTLTRSRVLSTPGVPYNDVAGGQMSLPAGTAYVEVVSPDLDQVAQNFDTADISQHLPPVCRGINSLAVGANAIAEGAGSTVIGIGAYGAFDDNVVIGATQSCAPKSACLQTGLGNVNFIRADALIPPSSPTPIHLLDFTLLSMTPGGFLELEMVACDTTATYWWHCRRRFAIGDHGIVATSADDVMASTIPTAPTVTQSVVTYQGDDWLRLMVTNGYGQQILFKAFGRAIF